MRAAERCQKAADAAAPRPAPTAPAVATINARLIQSERQFVEPSGLPRRSVSEPSLRAGARHGHAPVKTPPGVQAIEQKKYPEAETEVVRVARAIDRETAMLDQASADLEKLK